MLNLKVSRRFHYLLGMPADWTELPFLETIHVRESPAGRAPDNEVHDKEVMRVILIKIYRLIVEITRNGEVKGSITIMQKGTNCTLISVGREAKRNSFIIRSSHKDVTMEQIQVMGVRGLPLIHAGDNIAAMVCERMPVAGWRYPLYRFNHLLQSKRLHKNSCIYHTIRAGAAARNPEWRRPPVRPGRP